MSTYKHLDFELIATAIGTAVEPVANLESRFQAAALWFRLDKRRPKRIPPSKLRAKLAQVAKSARRLLKSLGINDPEQAVDGPGDREILNALVLTDGTDENPVLEATQRIGRLVEIIEGIAAAVEFERRTQKAATEVAEVGKLSASHDMAPSPPRIFLVESCDYTPTSRCNAVSAVAVLGIPWPWYLAIAKWDEKIGIGLVGSRSCQCKLRRGTRLMLNMRAIHDNRCDAVFRLATIPAPELYERSMVHRPACRRPGNSYPATLAQLEQVEPGVKFFNDFSRARACACAQGGVHSGSRST